MGKKILVITPDEGLEKIGANVKEIRERLHCIGESVTGELMEELKFDATIYETKSEMVTHLIDSITHADIVVMFRFGALTEVKDDEYALNRIMYDLCGYLDVKIVAVDEGWFFSDEQMRPAYCHGEVALSQTPVPVNVH